MTVRDVLYECACILGDTEFAIDLKLHDELINDETERKYKVMLSSFNAIVNEVAISYLAPTTYKPFDSKTINTNMFEHVVKKIISVTDSNGKNIGYTNDDGVLTMNVAKGRINYEYIPNDFGIDDNFVYEKKKIGKMAFAYGTAFEFCMREGRVDEAVNWESRYRQFTELKSMNGSKKLKAGNKWGL